MKERKKFFGKFSAFTADERGTQENSLCCVFIWIFYSLFYHDDTEPFGKRKNRKDKTVKMHMRKQINIKYDYQIVFFNLSSDRKLYDTR